MDQEVFIVFREKKYEPETAGVVAVFDSDVLSDKFIETLRSQDVLNNYNFYTIDEILRTDLP